MVGIVPSVEMVICAAVGGRLSLVGGVVGTLVVYYAKTFFSENFAEYWLYFIGALFMAVVVFLPKGLAARHGAAATPGERPGTAATSKRGDAGGAARDPGAERSRSTGSAPSTTCRCR